MQWRHGPVALGVLAALGPPRSAHAGTPEALVQVALHPTDPNVMAVRYVNGGDGLVVTRDAGKTWRLLCDAALFDPASMHAGPVVISSDGTLTMGVFTGMWHDDANACGWKAEPRYDGQWVADLALDPLDPGVTYAVTSTGGDRLNGISRRDASGTWTDVDKKQDLLTTDLHVVQRGAGRRFYVGNVKGQITPADGGTPKPNYVVRVSDDDGATFTEHVYGVANGEFHIQAIDPTNPDRLVASIERTENGGEPPGSARDSVLVSTDQGATFKEYLKITEIGGVAFAPDGRVWIGDAGADDPAQPRGVWFAASLGVPARKLPKSDYPVNCLGYQKATDTLYACQIWTLGSVDQSDGSFAAALDLKRVTGFVECAGVDMPATCQAQVCGAYCGLGHYAEAPVCCAYSSPSCGPAVATSGTASCPSTGGVGGRDGSSGVGGAGGGGTGTGAAGSSGLTDGGKLVDGGFVARGAADGGCCAIAGKRADAASPSAFGVFATALLALRRRRRPRGGSALRG